MANKIRLVLSLLAVLCVAGCSLVTVEQKHYKNDMSGVPQKEGLSFASKEALAAGATLQSRTAAEVFYKGTDAESKEAKILWDMSYRFLDLAGVNNDFDPADPESIERVFEKADKALAEKDQAIDKLEKDVEAFRQELLTNKKIVKDKEAELQSVVGKWRAKFDGLWGWIWGILIAGTLFLVGLGIAQVLTGIPFLSILFGGTRLVVGAIRQTVKGVQEVRDELKRQIETSEDEAEVEHAKKILAKMDTALQTNQDEKVKEFIKKQKEKVL